MHQKVSPLGTTMRGRLWGEDGGREHNPSENTNSWDWDGGNEG